MKIGLCTIAFSELPLEEVLNIASENGFDGVEIWGKEGHLPLNSEYEYVREIKAMADAEGLEIAAFGSYIRPLSDDFEEQAERALRITQGLGSGLMRVWSGGGPSKNISASDKRLITMRLKTLCNWAQLYKITIAVEMHGNNLTDNADSILELIEDVAYPGLKTYYQSLFHAESGDFYEAAQKIGKYIVNVHAQNAKRLKGGKIESCGIADGMVDYKKIVEILRQFDYDGYLEVEFVHGKDKLAALKKDRDFLAEIINL